MRARGTAAHRIATTAALGTLLAATIGLLPGLGAESSITMLVLLAGAPVAAFALVRAALDPVSDYVHTVARSLEGGPDDAPDPTAEVPRTPTPEAAQIALESYAVLRALERAVSRHRLARIEAEDEERSETAFLTDLSHELRTPLNAILGFSSVLLDEIDGPLSASSREDIETVQASGEHLRALVDDVLDMAALQSRRITLRRTAVAPGTVVSDVARLLEGQRRRRPVTVRAEVDPSAGTIRADETRLRQIVMNLGTNALKFTDKGEVVLSSVRDGKGVRITVRDTGPGIPPGQRDDIFLEFTQVSSGVMRRTQGSGLGLAIVKRLTELHGGKIWLESVTGEGSSFHVWLPDGGAE